MNVKAISNSIKKAEMSQKSENRINKNYSLYEIMIITYRKLKMNWYIIIIFASLGILLGGFGFNLDKESYNSLFSTMATISLSLVGFIAIFFVLLLETNRDSILDYVADVYRLKKEKVKKYDYIPITKSSTIKNIDNTLIDIKSILDNLKEERKRLGKYLNCFKDTFLFAIFSILLFMIPIALNHINFSNDNYSNVFKNWIFFKMFSTGFLFGLFFIILKDSAFILEKMFDKLDFFKQNQD